jgi:hypothetical protein
VLSFTFASRFVVLLSAMSTADSDAFEDSDFSESDLSDNNDNEEEEQHSEDDYNEREDSQTYNILACSKSSYANNWISAEPQFQITPPGQFDARSSKPGPKSKFDEPIQAFRSVFSYQMTTNML